MSSHQYVYVMHRLSKAWPGGKEVLKNISLSFLPGAKIGVLDQYFCGSRGSCQHGSNSMLESIPSVY